MAGDLVHAATLPNDRTPDELRLRPDDTGFVSLDPARAGWRYLSFRAFGLEASAPLDVGRTGHEAVVVPIAGGGLRISLARGGEVALAGRTDPFGSLPEAVYLPAGQRATLVAEPFEHAGRVVVAVAEAPSSGRPGVATAPFVVRAHDVQVEVRGAGNASRQVNHIIKPQHAADRLEMVEVLTPSGNWSSWPPHKHDVDAMPGEAVLEEVYYYRFQRAEGWGLQRLYRPDRSRDALWEVRTGEVVLVTDGYHPFVAAHGDDAYYLNALAGDRRTMACSYDPDLDWVRRTWGSLPSDARVPFPPRPRDVA